MKTRRKVKVKVSGKYLLLIFIATLLIGVGYASISGQVLQIFGDAGASGQTGVFITDVVQTTNVNASISTSKINYFTGTVVDSTVELGNTANSSITYDITVYNNSEAEYVFIGVMTDKGDESLYSNENIGYTLSGVQEYVTSIAPYQYLTFSVTFSYEGSDVSNKILNSILNYRFKEIPNIVLENEGQTIDLSGIYPGETFELPFTITYYPPTGIQNSSVNISYYKYGEEQISKMNYTLGALIGTPLEAKIYDAYGKEVSTDKEITIESNGTEPVIHYYTLEVVWDEQFNSKDYAIENFAGNVELIARPNDEKYLDYKVIKEFNLNVTTDMSYFDKTWFETTLPSGWDGETVTAITDETNVIPLPQGFTVSSEEGEDSYTEGVVIKDSSANEFVWVPYTGATTYSLSSTGYVEEELAYSQDRQDFQDMINTYNGFWIGRYNTTYDSFDEATDSYLGIGVKKSGTTLTHYHYVDLNEYYNTGELIYYGENFWQDFYDFQSATISANGGYSKMVSYLMCELASGVSNVSSLNGVWTQTAVPNDTEFNSMCVFGTANYGVENGYLDRRVCASGYHDIFSWGWRSGVISRMCLVLPAEATSSGESGSGEVGELTKETYSVSFYTNTTDSVSNMPSKVTVEKGTTASISSSVPTRDGCTFVEWNTNSDGSGTSYQPGDNITVTSDITLYAIWEAEVTSYTFNFNKTSYTTNIRYVQIYTSASAFDWSGDTKVDTNKEFEEYYLTWQDYFEIINEHTWTSGKNNFDTEISSEARYIAVHVTFIDSSLTHALLQSTKNWYTLTDPVSGEEIELEYVTNIPAWTSFTLSTGVEAMTSHEVVILKIPKNVKSVTISGESTVNVDETITLTADVSPTDADDNTVTWSSNNTAVATVNSSGVVTGVSAGTATITATAGGKKDTHEVTVTNNIKFYFAEFEYTAEKGMTWEEYINSDLSEELREFWGLKILEPEYTGLPETIVGCYKYDGGYTWWALTYEDELTLVKPSDLIIANCVYLGVDMAELGGNGIPPISFNLNDVDYMVSSDTTWAQFMSTCPRCEIGDIYWEETGTVNANKPWVAFCDYCGHSGYIVSSEYGTARKYDHSWICDYSRSVLMVIYQWGAKRDGAYW